VLVRKGRLKRRSHKQLSRKDAKYDDTDIALDIRNGLRDRIIKATDAYIGVCYRKGELSCGNMRIERVVNDALIVHTGGVFIDRLKINHNLNYFYSKRNHADSIHFQTSNEKNGVVINYVDIKSSGEGGEDKGHVMSSEIGDCCNFKMFRDGFFLQSKSKAPALNFLQARESIIGSPQNPIDPKKINRLSIRVMARKSGTLRTENLVIHVYPDQKVELDDFTRRGVIIRSYPRRWSRRDRIENWELFQQGWLLDHGRLLPDHYSAQIGVSYEMAHRS